MAPKYNRKKQAQQKPSSKGNSKRLYIIISVLAIIIAIVAGAYFTGAFSLNTNPQTSPAPNPTPATKNTKVLLQTNMGDITLQLFDDKPITTQNFLELVALGKYDGTLFHRIIKGFMIQGGTIYENLTPINDEIGSYNHNYQYTIAMAKAKDPNSATSGFFINIVDNSELVYPDGTRFDDVYTAFGKVIEGQEVVDAIANVQVKYNSTYDETSQPTQTITIIKATIIA